MSSEQQPKVRTKRRLLVLGILSPLLLSALYVLSLGPAVLLHPRSPQPVRMAIEFIYYPLEKLHRDGYRVGEPIDWYVELWRRFD